MDQTMNVLLIGAQVADRLVWEDAVRRAAPAGVELSFCETPEGGYELLNNLNRAGVLLERDCCRERVAEVVGAIRNIAPEAAVIVVADAADESAAQIAIAAGADDYVLKDECGYQMVGRVLRSARLRRTTNPAPQTERKSIDSLFQASPAPQLITTLATGKIVDANRALCRLTGYSREELIGHDPDDYQLWADIRQRRAILLKLRRGRQQAQREATIRTRSGAILELLISFEKIMYNGIECVLSSGVDISEQKQATQALEESEANFRAFFNTMDAMLFVLDQQGNILLVNQTVTQKTGFTQAELCGQSVLVMHPEERRAEAAQIVAEMLAGESAACPVPVVTKTGALIPVETRVFAGVWSGQEVLFGVSKDISQLKASEEKFAKVFKTSPAPLALTDLATGEYLDVNDAFLVDLGYSRAEVIGKQPVALGLFAEPEQRNRLLEKMQQRGYLRNEEVLVRAKSGEFRYGIFAAEYIRMQDRTLLLTVMNDITERKQMELALRAAEERWQFALDGAGDGVWDWNAQTNRVFYSRQWKQMLGYADHEVGDSLDEWRLRVHPDDLERALTEVGDYLAGKTEMYISEHRLRCKDGGYKWILDRGKVVEWTADHQPLRLIGTHTDIHQLKQAQQDLQESEARWKSILEAAPDATLVSNAEGKIVLANAQVERVLGYQRAELIGLPVEQLIPQTARSKHKDHREQYLSAPAHMVAGMDRYMFAQRKDGSEFPVEVSLSHHTLGDETVVLSTLRDVTERLRAEEALRHSERQMEALVTSLDDLVFEVNQQGMVLNLWTARQDMLIQPRDLMLGMKLDALWGKSTSQSFLETLDKVFAGGTAASLDFSLKIHENTRWFSARFSPILVAGEMPQTVSVLVREVTELKQTELELRKNERLLRLFVEHSPAEIAMFDTEMRYIAASRRYIQDYGLKLEDLTGRSHYEVFPEIPDRWKAIHRRCLNGAIERAEDDPFERESGNLDWVRWEIHPWYEDEGKIGGILLFSEVITPRKLAEAALRKAQEITSLVHEAADIGIWQHDFRTGTVYFDERARKHYGVDTNHTTLAAVFKRVHPADIERITKEIEQATKPDSSGWFSTEYRVIHPDGSIRWLEIGVRVWFEEIGGVKQAVSGFGMTQDITSRKQNEAKLQNSEERYRYLFENNPHPMWIYDLETLAFLGVNDAAVAKYGYSRAEFMQMTIADIRPREDLIRLRADLAQPRPALQHSGGWRHTLKDGSVIDVEISSHTLDIEGHHSALVVAMDVTERKQAEEALRKSEERFRTTFDTMLEGTQIIGYDWRYIYLNPAAERHNRRPNTELLGKVYMEMWPGIEETHVYSVIKECMEARTAAHLETEFVFPDGEARWYELSILPVQEGIFILSLDITERKQAEAESKKLTERLDLATRAARLGIWDWDIQKNELVWDAQMYQLYGVPLDAFGGAYEAWLKGLHPDDREASNRVSQQAVWGDGVYDTEFRVVWADGSVHWLKADGRVYRDGNGAPLRMVGVNYDITDRKLAAEELRKNERYLSKIMQTMQDGFWVVDRNHRFRDVNQAYCELSGYSREEILGMTIQELEVGETSDDTDDRFRKVIQAGADRFETRHRRKDGMIYDIEVGVNLLDTESGLMVCFCRDITERKQSELALRQGEERYRRLAEELEVRVQERTAEVQDLYDNAPCGYHSLDSEGKVLIINETELKWLGYARPELLGKPFIELITPASREVFRANFPEFKRLGFVRDIEFEFIRKDGSILPIIVSATAIYDQAGNYVMSRSTVFDNSERKKADEALRRANYELERALRMKDEFLANMSHELRTPLNGILNLAEILMEQIRGPLNEQQQKYVRNIELSGRHLLTLINDLLDLSKIEAGKLDILPELVVIEDVCQASLGFVKQQALKKNIDLRFEPEPLVSTMIADQRRVKQILVNLLSNAVKFTPANGLVQLSVKADYEQKQIVFRVHDTGIGIAPEDMELLFMPFTQVDSSLSRQHEGTGLGLALVKRLAELQGGSAWAESEKGKGSTFSVALPWQPAGTRQLGNPDIRLIVDNPGSSIQAAATQAGVKPRRILLVEDNETNIAAFRDYLEESGYEVSLARTGRIALEKIARVNPDLILMDIQIPEIDGLEVTRQLRAMTAFASVPIIALTALAMEGDKERCLAAGANDYLSKPVSLRLLADTIKRWIG